MEIKYYKRVFQAVAILSVSTLHETIGAINPTEVEGKIQLGDMNVEWLGAEWGISWPAELNLNEAYEAAEEMFEKKLIPEGMNELDIDSGKLSTPLNVNLSVRLLKKQTSEIYDERTGVLILADRANMRSSWFSGPLGRITLNGNEIFTYQPFMETKKEDRPMMVFAMSDYPLDVKNEVNLQKGHDDSHWKTKDGRIPVAIPRHSIESIALRTDSDEIQSCKAKGVIGYISDEQISIMSEQKRTNQGFEGECLIKAKAIANHGTVKITMGKEINIITSEKLIPSSRIRIPTGTIGSMELWSYIGGISIVNRAKEPWFDDVSWVNSGILKATSHTHILADTNSGKWVNNMNGRIIMNSAGPVSASATSVEGEGKGWANEGLLVAKGNSIRMIDRADKIKSTDEFGWLNNGTMFLAASEGNPIILGSEYHEARNEGNIVVLEGDIALLNENFTNKGLIFLRKGSKIGLLDRKSHYESEQITDTTKHEELVKSINIEQGKLFEFESSKLPIGLYDGSIDPADMSQSWLVSKKVIEGITEIGSRQIES